MSAPDRPVSESELLGRVTSVIRAGKEIALPAELSVAAKLIAKIIRRSVLAARALVYLHDVIRESKGIGSSVPGLATQVERYSVLIAIGGVAVRVNTSDADFLAMLEERYAGFVSGEALAEFDFDVELAAPAFADPNADVSVTHRAGRWLMERGDFRAEWDPAARRGWIPQSANPYSIDAVLRIVHTLVLARQGGFLLHSASAVRNGKAFLFAGVSGAGKTTISRLAPADATLLTDEISYVRKQSAGVMLRSARLSPGNWRSWARILRLRWPHFICWRRVRRIVSIRWLWPMPGASYWPICFSLPGTRKWFTGHFRRRATSWIACRFTGSRLCRMRGFGK